MPRSFAQPPPRKFADNSYFLTPGYKVETKPQPADDDDPRKVLIIAQKWSRLEKERSVMRHLAR